MAGQGHVVALRIVVRPPAARVVLDTNLFVAAYWSPRSASARIVRACEEDRLGLVYSPAIRSELFLILRNARTSADYQERIAELLDQSELVRPSRRIRMVAEDPDDDKFLECTVAAGADCLITSDDHLLRLGSLDGVPIRKPAAFAREVLG